ncbi:hypothetical protein niasHT_029944 [Heterodera trifolii]|uniref:Uncharacterized protein n=1 Tax=Heterodera trifolii TaxID=157864 RepID=A0ABD2JVN9_9BILA
MDDQSLDQSAGDQKAQYRRLKKESAEQDERISQLYEKKLKQEKQLAEQDERLARLRSNSEFQDAEIKRQAAEIKVQAEEIKVQAEEIKLLKLDRAEKEKKIKQLESDLSDLREIVNGIAVSHVPTMPISSAVADQFIAKNLYEKMVEEYEIELAGLSDHRDWQKSEAEQNLAHHLWDAEMEVKRLDYELTEHKKKRECYICLLHQTTNSEIGAQMEAREFGDTITQHNDLEELGETGSQTDIKQFTDICTQTNGQFIGHWRLLIGLFIIVLFVCGLLYNQFGPFRIALMLHYIRGPPPF